MVPGAVARVSEFVIDLLGSTVRVVTGIAMARCPCPSSFIMYAEELGQAELFAVIVLVVGGALVVAVTRNDVGLCSDA